MFSNVIVRMCLTSAVGVASALAFPMVVQAALPDRTVLTVDCSLESDAEGDDEDHGIGPDETLTVTFVNCFDEIEPWQVVVKFGDLNVETSGRAGGDEPIVLDEPISIGNPAFQLEVSGVAEIELIYGGIKYIDLDVYESYAAPDPSGNLLQTSTVTFANPLLDLQIPAGVNVNPGDSDEVLLGEIADCDIEPGDHVFREIEITIVTAGVYTFRKIAIDPIEEDLFWGVVTPLMGDSFLALYQGFDPASVHSNLVACNDDVDDLEIWGPVDDFKDSSGGDAAAIITSSGFLIDNAFPWMTVNLEPGTYTLVMMRYYPLSANEWAGTETITYEMWGPAGGISGGGDGGGGGSGPRVGSDYLDYMRSREDLLPNTL